MASSCCEVVEYLPLLNRDFTAMVAYAARIGMSPAVTTNGSLLTPKRIDVLVDAGLAKVCISIDAATASVHDDNRGLRGVSERIRRANVALKQRGISVTASVTMSRLVDYAVLPEALRDLAFGAVTFAYPLRNLRSSFLAHAESPLVEFTPEELCDAFEAVERVREHFPVLNPTPSIRDMQRHVRGEPELFECLGGWKSFYLDWHLKLWRCLDWDRPMCDIRDFDGTQRMRDRCTACMVDCYRDSSVMQHVGVAMSDGIHAAARGDLRQAWAHWMDRRNVVSVRAAMHTLGIWRRAP